jgi:hypothetical protein
MWCRCALAGQDLRALAAGIWLIGAVGGAKLEILSGVHDKEIFWEMAKNCAGHN